MTTASVPKVFAAISTVMAALNKSGIAKVQHNDFGRYDFRGIDDVYNVLAPILVEAGLVVIPRVASIESVVIETPGNKADLMSRLVIVDYRFVSVVDGSDVEVRYAGEAFDTSDKAASKAFSAAYKKMVFDMFCVPTVGDNDPDAHHHQREPEQKATKPRRRDEEPPRESDELPPMSKDRFDAAFPTWREKIQSGERSADGILSFLDARVLLTAAQRKKIKAIKAPSDEESNDD